MNIFSGLNSKSYSLLCIFIGLIPVAYFLFTGFTIDWVKISDPIAYSIHFYVLIPCSIMFSISFPVAVSFYNVDSYKKPIKVMSVISIFISSIISICIFLSGSISFLEAFEYAIAIAVILSPILLLAGLLMGRSA